MFTRNVQMLHFCKQCSCIRWTSQVISTWTSFVSGYNGLREEIASFGAMRSAYGRALTLSPYLPMMGSRICSLEGLPRDFSQYSEVMWAADYSYSFQNCWYDHHPFGVNIPPVHHYDLQPSSSPTSSLSSSSTPQLSYPPCSS